MLMDKNILCPNSFDEILKNQNLKSILVEINENYNEQLKDIEMIMSKFNFKRL